MSESLAGEPLGSPALTSQQSLVWPLEERLRRTEERSTVGEMSAVER